MFPQIFIPSLSALSTPPTIINKSDFFTLMCPKISGDIEAATLSYKLQPFASSNSNSLWTSGESVTSWVFFSLWMLKTST